MKSRRLTILCVAAIALVGTPRAWQEAGKLLAFAQYKAQVKFWSMVLQPRDRGESADAELVAAAQPLATKAAELKPGCALEKARAQGTQAAGSSKAVRRTDSAPSRPKARAQWQISGAPTSHAALIARAFKSQGEDGGAERLDYPVSFTESQPSRAFVGLPLHSGATALPRTSSGKSNNLRFVLPPATMAAAAALAEKESIVEFKLLKKSLEENRVIRQKGRLLKLRNADFGFRS